LLKIKTVESMSRSLLVKTNW